MPGMGGQAKNSAFRRWRRRLFSKLTSEGWRLQRQIRRTRRAYELDIAAAIGDQRQQIIAEMRSVLEQPGSALDRWETDKWIREALRYYVGIPPRPAYEQANEFWEFDHWAGAHVLTDDGKAEIRRRLREEWAWRRERWTSWAKVLIGLVTAGAAFLGARLGSK